MAGRPRKPTNVLAITGAFQKNPKRARERAGEPRPDGRLGDSPARWCPHPSADQAAALFAEGRNANEVATVLGLDWEIAKTLRPDASSVKVSADNEQLRELWAEVATMAPWLTSADRWTVASICELKLLEIKRVIKPGERAELGRLCGKCGLNPSDRSRVNTFPSAPKATAAADPRTEYMRRKMRPG